jgi:hypothetical protein
VHDHNGLAAWMQGRWRMKGPVVRDITTNAGIRR